MSEPSPANAAVVPAAEPQPRDVLTVPFVELFGNRLQGVVSSGSDVARVYCAFLEAGSGDHSSSTNNNRPDAGTDKRLRWLAAAAVSQFGAERVARFLQVPGGPEKSAHALSALSRRGARRQEPAGVVFSRFLDYLHFLERPGVAGPMPEMTWFVAR